MSYKVVLTADRTLMSNYGGGIFYGFFSTGPVRGFIPLPVLLNFVFKPVPVGAKGEALLAPQGLRRIESALIYSGFFDEDEVIVAPPETLKRVIGKDTRIIAIHSHDHLGKGPATTTFSGPTGIVHEEPISAWGFRTLVTSEIIRKAKRRGAVVVAGGPGAWQFTYKDMKKLGVDLVIYGEGELAVPRIFKEVVEGNIDLPKIIHISGDEIPHPNDIPPLRGATVGGIVEVSRGCGRGCSFCRPTLSPLRHRPLNHIIEDIKTNVRYGQRSICLHSEDILRYGAPPLEIRHEKVVELFKEASKVDGAVISSFSHANLSSIAASPRTVEEISHILLLDSHEQWIGYQTGIETGSPRLIDLHMRYKPYPFKPKEWPDVVEKAFGISVDNYLIPAATIIVNLPYEKEKDVLMTVELVERLKRYKSLLVPMLYVPPENHGYNMRFLEDAKWYHWELYRAIWRHNMRWLPEIVRDYSRNNDPTTRLFITLVISTIKWIISRKVEVVMRKNILRTYVQLKPRPGLEPGTCGLQGRRSTS